MDIRELRSFLLLAEQLHFGKASQLLHLSQPALTKQIRRLEEDLGSPLFERGKHGTKLSTFGQTFLQEARATVLQFDRLVEYGQKSALGEIGHLHIGFGYHTFELVPRLIVRLRKEAPGLEVSLEDMSTAEQIDGLATRQLDLGFIRMPAASAQLQTLPIVKDRLALISSSLLNLPAKAPLPACNDQPFVTIAAHKAPGFFNHMLSLCALHGFRPRIIQEVLEFTTVFALVRAGLGVAIIPESSWTGHIDGVRLYVMKEPEASWSVGAAWRTGDTNPALRRFLDLLQAEPRR